VSTAAIAGLAVLGLLVVVAALIVIGVVMAMAEESRRKRIVREQALADARLHHLTHTTMQRMFEAARQSQRP
jgi:undecaprenyl pyrophosphate phosphatase UppP